MNIVTLIVGNPSTGKTTSLRNLGPETFIINAELKPMPFRANGSVNYHLGVRDATPAKGDRPAIPTMSVKEHMWFTLDSLRNSDKYTNIVIDSFSSFTDAILAECKLKFKGYDIWNAYNSIIYDFFQKLKNLPNKLIFVIAHIEYLQDADGNTVIRTKAKGKEWEGLVEKEVTCVLYSRIQKKETGNSVDYQFVTNSDGYLPGKTPMDMYNPETEIYIPNDIAEVSARYRDYYKLGFDLKPLPVNSEALI